MLRITSVTFAGLLGLWSVSGAVLAGDITGEVGAGFSYQPRDPTGSRYEITAVPYFDLDWGNLSLDTDDGLRWSALHTQGITAGPYLNYLSGRSANGPLRGLRDVSDMAEVGGFVQYAPQEFWRIYANVGRAVGGGQRQGGVLGKLGGELGYPLGGGGIGVTGLKANFTDGRQANTFFGVNDQEAAASRFTPYSASGGFQDVSFTQSFAIPLASSWSLLASASWVHLTGSAANSSIVRQTGEANQHLLQAVISYTFD